MNKVRQTAPTIAGIRDDHVERYRWAADIIGDVRPDILDMGCGVGYGSQLLAIMTGGNVLGFDRNPDAIEYAREHYAHPHVHYAQRDLEALVKPSNTPFDVVTAFEVIEHSPAALTVLSLLSASLLFGSVPNQLTVPFDPRVHNVEHYRHFTPDELRAELLAVGWVVTEMTGQLGKRGTYALVNAPAATSRTICFKAVRA